MMNWLNKLIPLILVNLLRKQIMMIRTVRLKVKYLVLLAQLQLLLLMMLKVSDLVEKNKL